MTLYSADWFETFLSAADPPSVARELAFFEKHLPLPRHRRVLDVACGIGRHARALAAAGYHVLGVDISEDVLAVAREVAPAGATFVQGDMSDLDSLPSDFDVCMCLWQSFGSLSDGENRDVLAGMVRRVRPGGRVLLDIYDRDALPSLPTDDVENRRGREVETTRTLAGNRFRVRIRYDGADHVDDFDWQVFTPVEIARLGESVGLRRLFTCAWFDDALTPGPEYLRMQILFERGEDG